MKNPAYLLSNESLTVYSEGKTYQLLKSDSSWATVINALKAGDWEYVISLMDKPTTINVFGAGKVFVKNGQVYYGDEVVHNVITDRILQFISEELPIEPLVKFLENVMLNPSKRSVEELYKFLEHKGLPLTEDGCFLAYKTLRADGFDKYTGTIKNEIGKAVTMSRNKVDDDFRNECSHGIHVGCLQYSGPNGWYHNKGD